MLPAKETTVLENETSDAPAMFGRAAPSDLEPIIDLGDGWVGEWEDDVSVDEPGASEPNPVLAAAQRYLAGGWAPIPVPRGKKGPILAGWPNLRLTEADLPTY